MSIKMVKNWNQKRSWRNHNFIQIPINIVSNFLKSKYQKSQSQLNTKQQNKKFNRSNFRQTVWSCAESFYKKYWLTTKDETIKINNENKSVIILKLKFLLVGTHSFNQCWGPYPATSGRIKLKKRILILQFQSLKPK